MKRRTRQWTTSLAMVAGVLLGLWLLSTLRVESPALPPVERIHVSAPPIQPAKPAVKRPARPTPEVPVLAPLPEEEAQAELEDTAAPEVEFVTVYLTAEDYDGYVVDDARMGLMGCAMDSYTETAEGVEAQVEVGAVCTARGMRMDGMLRVMADPVEFVADADMDVVLAFPAERTGGIGVQFRPTDDGIVVVNVVPGTPAYAAGLSPGDKILSVGGIPTVELDAEAFVAEMTGPEGTDVEFELAFEADTGLSIRSVVLTRAFLSG